MLKGKWCLVTGSGRGIGKGIATAFAKEGASLALAARSADQLEEAKKECLAAGAEAVDMYAVDLMNPENADALAEDLLDNHGCVDVLVNNAGTGAYEDIFEGDPDAWEKTIALNLNIPMRLTRRLSPAMKEKSEGVIINIGSIFSVRVHGNAGPYGASKHGLRGWSLSCADAMRPHGIKVLAVYPGFVKTAMTDYDTYDRDSMMVVEDIAEACLVPFRVSQNCTIKEILMTAMQDIWKDGNEAFS